MRTRDGRSMRTTAPMRERVAILPVRLLDLS